VSAAVTATRAVRNQGIAGHARNMVPLWLTAPGAATV